jgi:hypothetical protein
VRRGLRSILARARSVIALPGLLAVFACVSIVSGADDKHSFSSGDFRGPEFCGTCHPQHYQEWRGSAHAYSTLDPIFLACSRKAQAETGGEIGSLCVGCHAPTIDRTGELPPTFGLEDLKKAAPVLSRGVSCEVCHRMEPPKAGAGIGNASFELARGKSFFGRLLKPQPNAVHDSVHSDFLGESAFCGSCHDVLHHDGEALERTFVEWSDFVRSEERKDRLIPRCQNCHMLPYSGVAARGSPFRDNLHRHNFPGVSVPLMKFPNKGYQREEIVRFLRTAARMSVIVPTQVRAGEVLPITVLVKNSGAGHHLPSGISTFRQMWLEVTLRDSLGAVVFASGHLDSNGDLMDAHSVRRPNADSQLVSFSDRFRDEAGREVLFLWEADHLEVRSLRPDEERGATYRVAIPETLGGAAVTLEVRLLFRFFGPYGLRAFGVEDTGFDVPIWEVDAYRPPPLQVVREIERRRRYRVPGDFTGVQKALDELRDGDHVVVEAGEHTLTRPLDFYGKAIHLESRWGAGRTTLHLESSEPGSVAVFRGQEGPGTILQGFTLTGGSGTEIDGLLRGGGIYVVRASPTLLANRIVANHAAGGVGGGICLEESQSLVEGNVLEANWALRGGGLAWNGGPQHNAALVLTGNEFHGNIAYRGGGAYLESPRDVVWKRAIFAGNTALEKGGAVFVEQGGHTHFERSTVVTNRSRAGFAVLGGEGTVAVSNSIVWGNKPLMMPATYRYTLLGKKKAGLGNLEGFPLFVDPTGMWEVSRVPPAFLKMVRAAGIRGNWPGKWIGGNYELLGVSPAIDAGDPASVADHDDSRADLGARVLERPLRAFIRGDMDDDGAVGWSDVARWVRHFVTDDRLTCLDAADVDDSGVVGPLDALRLATFLVSGFLQPSGPYPLCGVDPTFGEGLSCEEKNASCLASEREVENPLQER